MIRNTIFKEILAANQLWTISYPFHFQEKKNKADGPLDRSTLKNTFNKKGSNRNRWINWQLAPDYTIGPDRVSVRVPWRCAGTARTGSGSGRLWPRPGRRPATSSSPAARRAVWSSATRGRPGAATARRPRWVRPRTPTVRVSSKTKCPPAPPWGHNMSDEKSFSSFDEVWFFCFSRANVPLVFRVWNSRFKSTATAWNGFF